MAVLAPQRAVAQFFALGKGGPAVMAKASKAGRSKTRLGAVVGPETATLRRTTEERGEAAPEAKIVALCLLAQAADGHVFDHAPP